MNKYLSTLAALLLLVLNMQAQSIDDILKPVTRTYALKNVVVVPGTGGMIEGATVIIKNGLIHAVGKDIDIPAGAQVLETDSMYVYPGFIDALSHVGIPAPKQDNSRSRFSRPQGVDPGNPPRELAGVMPDAKTVDKLSVKDSEIAALRKLGFTAAHSVPRGMMLPGKGAVIVLAGETERDMIIMEDVIHPS